jgi:hypothetical protein
MNTILNTTLILGYREFFQGLPPKNRLTLLNGICKKHLITEFAGLNYRLKPKNSRFYDTTFETQVKELEYITGIDQTLHKHYSNIAQKYTKSKNDYPIIFTRATCMFALEEIIQSDLPVIEGFSMNNVDIWNSIFKYILAVNTTITEIKDNNENQPINFETLNPKLLPLNELSIDVDPFAVPFRAYSLFEFLNADDEVKPLLEVYLKNKYGLEFDRFIYEVVGMYLANKHENPILDFAYNVPETQTFLFEAFSKRIKCDEIHKMLCIRKYPFYKVSNQSYLLTDNVVLLDKLYSQFINDFWFDYIKPIANWNIKKYRSVIGYFFESYTKSIIDYSFQNSKYYVIRQFQELKINYHGNSIEIADVYIRHNSKILLGEVKSTSIYDTEKYSGNLDGFYKNDREKFFDTFGVDQIVHSIKRLNETMPYLDNKFPFNKLFRVFPVIIFNDKALQTPMMAHVFQERFVELLKEFKSRKIYVYPLSLIHISDLECIQDLLNESPEEIWDLLKYNCRYPSYMPPFYNSINRKDIRTKHKRPMALYQQLIPKFSGE